MKGREIIFFPSSTSRLSSRAVIFTSTRVYCSLIIPEVNEGPKLTIYTLFVFFAYLSVFFVSASSLLKQAINAFWSVKEATQKKKIQVLPIVVEPMTSWPQLFNQGIALSTGLVTIQRISISKKPIALSA